MSLVTYTQTRLDAIVIGFSEEAVRIADIAMALRSYSDPGAFIAEEDLMTFHVFLDSIRNYDVLSGVLTQEDINDIIEMCTQIVDKYNLQFAN